MSCARCTKFRNKDNQKKENRNHSQYFPPAHVTIVVILGVTFQVCCCCSPYGLKLCKVFFFTITHHEHCLILSYIFPQYCFIFSSLLCSPMCDYIIIQLTCLIVSVLQGCHNKILQTEWLTTEKKKMHFLAVLEASSSKSRIGSSLGAQKENLFQARHSPSFWDCWPSLAHGSIISVSASIIL